MPVRFLGTAPQSTKQRPQFDAQAILGVLTSAMQTSSALESAKVERDISKQRNAREAQELASQIQMNQMRVKALNQSLEQSNLMFPIEKRRAELGVEGEELKLGEMRADVPLNDLLRQQTIDTATKARDLGLSQALAESQVATTKAGTKKAEAEGAEAVTRKSEALQRGMNVENLKALGEQVLPSVYETLNKADIASRSIAIAESQEARLNKQLTSNLEKSKLDEAESFYVAALNAAKAGQMDNAKGFYEAARKAHPAMAQALGSFDELHMLGEDAAIERFAKLVIKQDPDLFGLYMAKILGLREDPFLVDYVDVPNPDDPNGGTMKKLVPRAIDPSRFPRALQKAMENETRRVIQGIFTTQEALGKAGFPALTGEKAPVSALGPRWAGPKTEAPKEKMPFESGIGSADLKDQSPEYVRGVLEDYAMQKYQELEPSEIGGDPDLHARAMFYRGFEAAMSKGNIPGENTLEDFRDKLSKLYKNGGIHPKYLESWLEELTDLNNRVKAATGGQLYIGGDSAGWYITRMKRLMRLQNERN